MVISNCTGNPAAGFGGRILYLLATMFQYPFWGEGDRPAALLPMPIAKAILFPIGVAALAALFWTLRRLAASAFSLDRTRAFWVAALTMFLAGRFVIRDLAELGVNTLLVALSWLAIYLWTQRRDLLAGTSLGAAIALKCTPAIFVAYFLWKRQWRMVAATCLATALFTLAPIVGQGPDLIGTISRPGHLTRGKASATSILLWECSAPNRCKTWHSDPRSRVTSFICLLGIRAARRIRATSIS